MELGQEGEARLEGSSEMTAGTSDNLGTTAVRANHQFDEAALFTWMRTHVDGFTGPLSVEQFKGGQSNPTYKLTTPLRSYVLRRKPPGPLLKGAHAIDREARILSALGKTGFPVPHVFAVCTDDNVIGSWFYIMEMVEGRVFWDATFPDVRAEDRRRYFDAMNQTLAMLHGFDPEALSLADYGRPGNYFERQIARWSKQYREDPEAGRDAEMDRLIEWLPANIPPGDETAVVHGDFRCDNLIFHPVEPRVIAVLDWELSTLGNPLADFAYHAMMFRMPPDIVAGLGGADLVKLGIPSEADYLAAYLRNAGRPEINPADYNFYITFNLFRLAAIFHGIKGRVIRGTAASAHARERAANYTRLARLACESVDAPT